MTTSDSGLPAAPVLAFALVLGTVGLVAGVAGLILAVQADSRPAVAAEPEAAEVVGEMPASTVDVSLSEFAIDGDLRVPAGMVTLAVVNEGSAEHNLVVSNGARSSVLAPGSSEAVDLGDLPPGDYGIICDVPGHEAAGMSATLSVTPATAAAEAGSSGAATDTTAAGHGAEGDEPDWDALDMAMMETMLAFPAETVGKGNLPLEPTILPDGTKQFELTAEIVQWEVEPGKLVEAWTYNGMVPGPLLRVDLGDRVQIVVHNELPMGTDVHWHGISTPFDMDGVAPYTQELIRSGDDFVYEFDAEEPAIGMYHAHHHGQMQVPNGMFGPFIIGDTPIPYGRTISGIEIPETIELTAEIPMVLNDAGTIGFSLNGKSFPATEPLVVAEGDWFVVHYYNEGLGAHPMHLHQFEQLIFAKDGIPLDEPYFADTINIAPGERYSVLVQADRAGTWVWHCHILTHVEREEGMFGMVTAVVVEPADA